MSSSSSSSSSEITSIEKEALQLRIKLYKQTDKSSIICRDRSIS